MRVFQNQILSGSPSRFRGPGSNSRKKSASLASKDRNPFGTIFKGRLSEEGVMGGVATGKEGVANASPRRTKVSCAATSSGERRKGKTQKTDGGRRSRQER